MSLKNDIELMITDFKKGQYDKGTVKTLRWSTLVNKLSKTVKTSETVEEYKSMTPDKKNLIKNIGGIVAGELKDGLRGNNYVLNRTSLTLDIDKFEGSINDFWTDFTVMYPNTNMLLFTTHSNTKEAASFRVFIPLSRPVSPDEYKAIASKVAEDYDLSVFDPVSFRVSQLMYYPSTPIDGEFISLVEENGTPLDVESVLNRYEDYTDVSSWAITQNGVNNETKNAKKGNPLELKGAIGAFCKTFNIQEVIDYFLSDVYEPTSQVDRYTYIHGSSFGGLVVHQEGLFGFSHHGSDPASEQLLNSYDLVRIHRFSHLDTEVKENTPINRLPSSVAMNDWIRNAKGENEEETAALSKVKVELAKSTLQLAQEDFEDYEEDSESEENKKVNIDAVIVKLDLNKKGEVESSTKNIAVIINELFGHTFKFDLFANKAIRVANVPWWKNNEEKLLKPGEMADWNDEDTDFMLLEIEKIFNINIQFAKARIIADKAIQERAFNPVMDIIKSKPWDGVERAETLLIKYMGASDTEYTRLVTKHFLTGAVKRIFEPGCKMDEALILIGAQGIAKSLLSMKLAINEKWHTDSLNSFDPKKGGEVIEGKWIIELGELDAMRKAEVTEVKRFISAQSDKFRKAYSRNAVDIPRKCVFIGTTNEAEFLRDDTGNRRYLPIECSAVRRNKHPADLTKEDVQQIYAEVLERWYKAGKPLYMDDKLKSLATEQQKAHTSEDIRLSDVREYVNKPIPLEFDKWSKEMRKSWINHLTASAPEEFNTWPKEEKFKWYEENHDQSLLYDYEGVTELVLPMRISVKEIMEEALKIDTRNIKPHEMRSYSKLVKQLGWDKSSGEVKKTTTAYGQQRVFERV